MYFLPYYVILVLTDKFRQNDGINTNYRKGEIRLDTQQETTASTVEEDQLSKNRTIVIVAVSMLLAFAIGIVTGMAITSFKSNTISISPNTQNISSDSSQPESSQNSSDTKAAAIISESQNHSDIQQPQTSVDAAPSSSTPVKSQPISSSKTTEPKSTQSGVYITPNGKKYHFSPTCGGKNSYEVTLEEAIQDGKTPCQRCTQ